MEVKATSFAFLAIICSSFFQPTTCMFEDMEKNILNLKLKAITSIELQSMTFNEIPNSFFLYEILTEKRYETINKNVTQNDTKFEEFRKIHQYHAIRSTISPLELRDVIMNENFDAKKLEIFNSLPNWTDDEIKSYELLGKDEIGNFKFHDNEFANYFIAEYFLDNIFEPAGHQTDDEVELRLRFLLHVAVDKTEKNPILNELLMSMIEDRGGQIFSEQIRMLMKCRFSGLFETFLPKELKYIEKISRIFAKDEEILKNLWGVGQNQPYFLRFFKFSSATDKVYELKEVVEKFFKFRTSGNETEVSGADLQSNNSKIIDNVTESSTSQTQISTADSKLYEVDYEQVFTGKNQFLNALYRIYNSKDENFTKNFLEVTKFNVSDNMLAKLNQYFNFLDYVDSQTFSTEEKREFYFARRYDLMSNAGTGAELNNVWRRFQKYFDTNELKDTLIEKDRPFNHTHLFYLPSQKDQSYVESFLTLFRRYLSLPEIRELLDQRHPITRESFIIKYLLPDDDENIVRIIWEFAKKFLSTDELKKLILDNELSSVQKASGKFSFLLSFK